MNSSPTPAAAAANGNTSGLLRQAAGQQVASTSRRNMLRRGGMVAAAAAGLTLLDQRRAEAATGDAFILGHNAGSGNVNNANATTELRVTSAGTTLVPLFRVNGTGLSGTSTSMIVDGPGSLQGIALIVNGNSGGTGLITSASKGPQGTTGLALAASGGNGADAIHASSDHGTAVSASSGSSAGVRASGKRGGVFTGSAAAIQLTPHAGAHPTKGQKGDLFVDHNTHLFFCRGGTNWVKLA
jgi:hypothetical protein